MQGPPLTATFPDRRHAAAAVKALEAAGIPAGAISIEEGAFGRGQEGRFLWRVLALIVMWSIPGGAAGAAAGAALAFAGLGPDGTMGLMVQVVSWLIIGHLLAGMLAGYLLLADRSQREMAPDRPAFVVTMRCLTGTERRAAIRALSKKD